jgi:hypothetical protein
VSGSGGKYEKNATTLGAMRYPDGVRNAEGAYQQGVDPYLNLMRGLDLGPKGPRRSQQQQARANKLALELGKKKEMG